MLESFEDALEGAEVFFKSEQKEGEKVPAKVEKKIYSRLHFLFSDQRYIDTLE